MTARLPYGSWPSPISAARVSAGTLRLDQPQVQGDAVYWVEGRPTENGRCVLMRAQLGPGGVSARTELTPMPCSVKSRTLESGGGAYAIHNNKVWFVNDADQCVYSIDDDGIHRVTQPGAYRFADLQYDAGRNRLLAVSEDHGGAGEPACALVAIALADGALTVLHAGDDFYSTPRLAPDGKQLAWLTWNHPAMPWDATELWVATVAANGELQAAAIVAGGAAESIVQPEWSPRGVLHFVSDRTDGWWNIHRREQGRSIPITHETEEFAMPRWAFGMRHYGFLADGTLLVAFTRDGQWQLARIAARGKTEIIPQPFTAIEHLHTHGQSAVLLGGAPDRPLTVAYLTATEEFAAVVQATEAEWSGDWFSRPEPVRFATADDDQAYALYYPPTNPDCAAPAGELPLLLVKCHGGPTGATSSTLDLKIQFWTSRGFAVLDINYRGSTGYGRAYREKLYGQWGIADVADCVAGAQHLVAQGRADPRRLCISGNSAGGFTVLAALTFHDVFAAGASYYGIGDLVSCMRDTHKFEARYGDRLLGPLPEALALYQARSPLLHAAQLHCPVIFFQGLDDKVVPPDQARTMHAALKVNGVATALLLFAGEGHGFRRAATIEQALNSELGFYGRVLGFTPADALPPLAIDNLEPG